MPAGSTCVLHRVRAMSRGCGCPQQGWQETLEWHQPRNWIWVISVGSSQLRTCHDLKYPVAVESSGERLMENIQRSESEGKRNKPVQCVIPSLPDSCEVCEEDLYWLYFISLHFMSPLRGKDTLVLFSIPIFLHQWVLKLFSLNYKTTDHSIPNDTLPSAIFIVFKFEMYVVLYRFSPYR